MLDPDYYESKKSQALTKLFFAQKEGEGITPGIFRGMLSMEREDWLEFVDNMVDDGFFEVLPEAQGRGSGRTSAIIHCPKVLRGPKTPREMVDKNFTPKMTEDPNPFYVLDRAERGESDNPLAAVGIDAVFVVTDQLFKMGRKPFTKDQLAGKLNIRVPSHIVDFVWNRFTIKLFEETMLNGGFDYNESDKTLTRRRYWEDGSPSELNSAQMALEEAFTNRLSSGSNPYIKLPSRDQDITSEDLQPHMERFANDLKKGGGSLVAVIEHPKLKTLQGNPPERRQRAEVDGDGRSADSPLFAVWDYYKLLPSTEYQELLVEAAQFTPTLEEALEIYEEK